MPPRHSKFVRQRHTDAHIIIYNSIHARARTHTHTHTLFTHYREEEMETDTVSRVEQMFMRADLRVESERRISKGSEFH